MNCPQCGSQLSEKDRFCRSCGAIVAKPQTGKRPRIRVKDILPGAVFGTLALTVVLLIYIVGASMQSSPRIRSLSAAVTAPTTVSLSAAQIDALETYGAPQAFNILFYTEADDGGIITSYRHESWTFFSAGVELVFLNGSLIEETPLSFSGSDLQPLPYLPEQFQAFMTLDEISAVLGEQEVLEIPVEPELAVNGSVYYAGQLSFALAEGELVYLETIPVQDAGE